MCLNGEVPEFTLNNYIMLPSFTRRMVKKKQTENSDFHPVLIKLPLMRHELQILTDSNATLLN